MRKNITLFILKVLSKTDIKDFILIISFNSISCIIPLVCTKLVSNIVSLFTGDVLLNKNALLLTTFGYLLLNILLQIIQPMDDKRIPVLPYKRPMGKQDFFKPYEYVYDKYYDCVICPENHVLNYATTNREGYREFKSKTYICENCPSRYKCTENSKYEKTVTKHIWSDYLEKVEDIRHTPKYKEMYERRKETIERVFADAKEKHAMRYTPYRGLSQVTNWVRLKFAAMNLKKYAVHRWKRLNVPQPSADFSLFSNFLFYFNFKTLKLS